MNSTGMTSAPGARAVRFRGFSLALMLLSTCACGGEFPYLSILANKCRYKICFMCKYNFIYIYRVRFVKKAEGDAFEKKYLQG